MKWYGEEASKLPLGWIMSFVMRGSHGLEAHVILSHCRLISRSLNVGRMTTPRSVTTHDIRA